MLSISTVEEALTYLSAKTGRTWTRSELFDIVSKLNISLCAVVPLDVLSSCWHFVDGTMCEKSGWSRTHPMFATLYPHDVASVWQLGEASVHHAEDRHLPTGELNLLTVPIRVTANEVRIREEALGQVLTAWADAQSGQYWWRVPKWARPPRNGEQNQQIESHPAQSSSSPVASAVAPWLQPDPRDEELEAFAPWGVSARYFARELVRGDPSLLTKREALAAKVGASLDAVNIKKRGGVRSLDPTTIKKAFSNLDFS